ncbi:hypothetical protein [Fodinibius sp. Rm-B-1B1-1]|uniref:hypothetical protein n=1 Tax=Fodinibius alkaliphilus TaxID=3140241 RepID=UPI00315B2F26
MDILLMKSRFLIIIFLVSVSVISVNLGYAQNQEKAKNTFGMEQLNPNAPKQLSAFGFLLGKWNCKVIAKQEDGTTSELRATWKGQTILDGYVIADEYQMMDSEGSLVMLGMNYRAYNTETDVWNMKWLEALSGTWLDLGTQELGGVQITDTTIVYKAEYKPGELHRISFSDITENHFIWSVDISTDGGQSWNESVMIIQANRSL